MRGRSASSNLRLQDGVVERGGAFGRTTEDALLGRSGRARGAMASLRDWLVVLLVVGCAFAGLGLVGMAEIEPRRVGYEQGKATRAVEQGEAGSRRGCLVIREASSRVNPKAVVAAVRLPPQRLGTPAGLPAGGEMLVAKVAGPGLRAAVAAAGASSLRIGGRPDRGRPVQTARSGLMPTGQLTDNELERGRSQEH